MMEVAITRNTAELERLEGIIRRNQQSFYEIGSALREIRDKGLYRDVKGYDTFEEYCKKEWDFSRPRAYQLIEAVTVKDNLSTTVDIPERQLRPLAHLEPEKQKEAWTKAVSTAPDGKVTAAHVYKIVRGMTEAAREEITGIPYNKDHEYFRKMHLNCSVELLNLEVAWDKTKKADKIRFGRWLRYAFPEYLKDPGIPTKEQFFRSIKTHGHSADDESDALFHLKRYWMKATRKDKENLFSWLKEAR